MKIRGWAKNVCACTVVEAFLDTCSAISFPEGKVENAKLSVKLIHEENEMELKGRKTLEIVLSEYEARELVYQLNNYIRTIEDKRLEEKRNA